MRQRSEAAGIVDAAPAGPGTTGDGEGALTVALRRCAEGDRSALDDLRRWENGRLRGMLVRMLGDPALAERVLDAALDDLYRNAVMLDTLGRGPAEDRVFALVRRHAYAALRAGRPGAPPPPATPRLQPVPGPPPAPPPARAEAPPAPPPAAEPEPDERPAPIARGVVTPLAPAPHARRPGLADAPDEEDEDEEQALAERAWRRRRWSLLVLAWLLAAAVGFGLAYVGALLLLDDRPWLPAAVEPSAGPPPAAALPPPAVTDPARSVEPAPAPPPAAELLGAPLAAPEPPVTAGPPLPAPPSPPRATTPPPAPRAALPQPAAAAPAVLRPGAPLPASARIFIHHTASDREAAARASALAERLQERGAAVVVVRPVPFAVQGMSVRYFHPADRAGAAAVLPDAAAFAGGRTIIPSTPADFTHFEPAPRLGTIEVWLPGGT